MSERPRLPVGRLVVAGGLACAALLASRTSRGDGEVWLWTEHQVRIADGSGDFPRTNLRYMGSTRFSGRGDGLDFALARIGPMFTIAPWLTTAFGGTAVGFRPPNGAFIQEYRGELDLVPHGRLGDFALASRNRFEYVWRDAGAFTRYRNMVRVAYSPREAKWIPFTFVDVFLRPTRPHLQETWWALGLGRVLGGAARLDVAYMLRTRDGNDGELDHVLWTMLFFGVPEAKPTPHPEPVGGHGD